MAWVYFKKSEAQIAVGSHASYVIQGDDDEIAIGDNSNLIACGTGFSITVQGVDDVVTVGNAPGATGGKADVVTFLAPGLLHERASSNVAAQGDYCRVWMAGDDTLTVNGRGDSVYAAGADDRVTIGLNGFDAVGTEQDAVYGLAGGSLFVLDDSNVRAIGDSFTATIGGHDRLAVLGNGAQIYATGDDDVVAIGGPNQTGADDDALHMNNGVVAVGLHSSVEIFGDNLRVRGAGYDTVSIVGADDRVSLGCFGNNVVIGQNGGGGGVDVLQFSYAPLIEPIAVLPQSNVSIIGSNANVTLGGHDQVTVVGFNEQIVDQTGNNHISIGGNGSPFFGPVNNYVSLAPGDTVTMLANSNLTLAAPDSTTNGQYAVRMSAQDALLIDGAMTVYVPVAAGADLLLNFNANDVLRLASHFSSVADLLAHTSQNSAYCTTIQLDAGSDTLTLGLDKATFTTYAQAGLIKFN